MFFGLSMQALIINALLPPSHVTLYHHLPFFYDLILCLSFLLQVII